MTQSGAKAGRYDIIIVGAGHNGLVTAAYLARAGYRVVVLERRDVIGGACVTEEVWPGYKVSTASYVNSLLRPEIIRELDLAKYGFEMLPRNPSSFSPFPDGRYLMLGPDKDLTRREMSQVLGPGRGRAAEVRSHARAGGGLHRANADDDAARPVVAGPARTSPRSAKLGWEFRKLGRKDGAAAIEILTGAARPILDRWFESEQLKVTLATDAVIGAMAAPSMPGTAYVLFHHVMGETNGVRGVWGYVRGGMGGISNAIAGAARAAGAEIRTQSEVARILVRNGAVEGVALVDGTEFRAPRVASGADAHVTFERLVDRKELPDRVSRTRSRPSTTAARASRSTSRCSELPDFTACPGDAPGPQHRGTIHICPTLDYIEEAYDDAKYGRPARNPMLECTIPSVLDDTVAPQGAAPHVDVHPVLPVSRCATASPSRRRRNAFADRCFDIMTEYAPNFRRVGDRPAGPGARRHRAPVWADRRQHHAGRDVTLQPVLHAADPRVRGLSHTHPRPVHVRCRDPSRRRRHGCVRLQCGAGDPAGREGEVAPMPALERTLPRRAYFDEDVYQREREGIFSREWYCAGREESVPAAGDYAIVTVAGESVLLVRGTDGALRGFFNVCRHRGCELVLTAGLPPLGDRAGPSGHFAGAIRCPYHSWTYALDGALRTAPFLEDDAGFSRSDLPLHPVGIGVWGGFVFVNLTPARAAAEGRTLAAQLGDAPARVARYPLAELRTAHRIVYDVAANWKVMLENYNECYHCAGVHPELCALVPAFKFRGGSELDWESGIPHRPGAWTFTETGTSTRAPFAGLDASEQVRHKGELLYPNLMLSLSADHVAAFTLWPQGANADDDRLRLPVRSCGDRQTGLRPIRRGELLGSRQSPGLGDLRGGTARHALSHVRARILRADGELESRYPALRA